MMGLAELSIRRPVMTILVMAALILFGALGYWRLPVSELPAIEFPTISISASLPGADPETMASSVATPLENKLATIAGIESMSSSSTLGSTRITLQFALDRDIDAAAQDVQTALSSAQRDLPDEMTTPPTFRKSNPADSPVLYLAMSSSLVRLSDINDYAEGQLARRLSVIPGVAEVSVYGSQKYAVRLQVDPNALAARGLGLDEVASAAKALNVSQPVGTLSGPTRTATLHSNGKLTSAADFAPQVITYRNGAPVRFQDIGQVVDSVENTKVASWFNGQRAIILALKRQPGANTIAMVDRVKEVLPTFQAQLPPAIELEVLYDRSQTIRASVHDVQFTLILSAALVVMVIFLFLRSLSATIIPSLALPIAVVGTFAGMAMMGYSLDNLSLMALTLSVGFVVDDAIVMLENIVRHLEKGKPPFLAALDGAREVGFTIISMTISLAAVFIPVLFMGGVVGRLLNEFAVTIVIAIIVSGVISVTLTPMLCSRLLKAHAAHDGAEASHGALYRASERAFLALQDGYQQSLALAMRYHRLTFCLFLGSVAASWWLFTVVSKDFLPVGDSGQISAYTEGTVGASLEEMAARQQQIAEIIRQHPAVEGVMSSVGAGGPRASANSGTLFISLKPFDQRNESVFQVVQDLRPKVNTIPGLKVYLNIPPSIRLGGTVSKAQYQYTLQDLDLQTLYQGAMRLTDALSQTEGFVDVTSNLELSSPAIHVEILRDRAAVLGVTPAQIESALGSAFGGRQVSTLYKDSDQYQVILELLPRFQQDASGLDRLYVRSERSGQLVPLSAVVEVSRSSLAQTVNHLGQLPAVTVSFNLAPGVSLGDGVERLEALKQQIGLPATTQTTFEGTAQAFTSSLSGMGGLLVLAVLVVYIVLGILYESFIHPLTILSGLPAAAVGALLALDLLGMPLNLYGFVGVILLVGIVKKNAIMMIDFALVEERVHKRPPHEAIFDAAVVRFRPIMMTTMAALMGAVPIALAYGEGGESRQPLGVAVVGGLLLSQVLTLYITPVLYLYMDRLFRGKRQEASPLIGGQEQES